MRTKTLSNSERTCVSIAVIAVGMILICAVDIVEQAISSLHPSLGAIANLSTYAVATSLILWGIIITCQTRFSFQLDGDILNVCRKTARNFEILPIKISEIEQLRAKEREVIIVLADGASLSCRKPFSDHSKEVLSTVSSIVSIRQQGCAQPAQNKSRIPSQHS